MRKEIMYMIAYPDGTLVMNTQKYYRRDCVRYWLDGTGLNKIKNRRLALRAYKIRVKQYPYDKPLIDRNNLAFVRKENDGNRCDCFGHWLNYWNTRPF